MRWWTRSKLKLRAYCRDALVTARLKLLRHDSLEAERTRVQYHGRKIDDTVLAFLEGMSLERATDKNVLQCILSYLVGNEEKAQLYIAFSKDDLPRAIDFVHRLIHNESLWRRVKRLRPGISEDRLCTLALDLSRRCDTLPPLLSVVASGVLDVPDRLGSGTDVYRGMWNGQRVSVKRLRYFLNMPASEKSKVENMFFKEATVWAQLRHPNILPILGIDKTNFKTMPCMISPWMDNGSITQYRSHLIGQPSVDQLNKWILEVASGLAYLHSHNIIHGDVRGANVLITRDSVAKLADFGVTTFARKYARDYYSWHDDSESWDAPELIERNAVYPNLTNPSPASDVYSFGLVCIEIYTGEKPFPKLSMTHIRYAVLRNERPPRPTHPPMSDECWSEVQRCWSQQPQDRPPITDVIHHLHNHPRGSPHSRLESLSTLAGG